MGTAIRRTYEPGQFSQVNLPDGTKLLITTGRSDIRVTKLGFLNLPAGVIWKFDFRIPIQTDPANPPEYVKAAMDAILGVVESCGTLNEVQRKLSADGARLLTSVVGAEGAPEEGKFREVMEKELVKKMATGVGTIQMGIAQRLFRRFERTLSEKPARQLAAAVVNTLFFQAPSNEEGAEFLKQNYQRVQEEIANLRTDQEIRNGITQAFRVQMTILHACGQIGTEEMVSRGEKLMSMGILLPGGEFPQVEAFVQLATEFWQSAIRGS